MVRFLKKINPTDSSTIISLRYIDSIFHHSKIKDYEYFIDFLINELSISMLKVINSAISSIGYRSLTTSLKLYTILVIKYKIDPNIIEEKFLKSKSASSKVFLREVRLIKLLNE